LLIILFRYEELIVDEKRIQQDLKTMKERVFAWDRSEDDTSVVKASIHQIESKPRLNVTEESSGILPEVTAFQSYLVKWGGYYGGWDDLSHGAFIKLRQKYVR
jgi:hypothetical protein